MSLRPAWTPLCYADPGYIIYICLQTRKKKHKPLKQKLKPDLMAHTFNPSTQEEEAGGLL